MNLDIIPDCVLLMYVDMRYLICSLYFYNFIQIVRFKTLSLVVVCCKCNKPIRSTVFNYNTNCWRNFVSRVLFLTLGIVGTLSVAIGPLVV